MGSRPGRTKPRVWWSVLWAAVAASIAVVGIPVFLIQPFRTQSETALAVSFALRTAAPILTTIAVVLTAVAAWRLGRTLSGVRRAIPLAGLLVAAGSAWFARQNHFEWMFRPLPKAGFVHAGQATFLEPDDLVLGVAVNGDAAAYPVNQVAYHHVINDEVGGIPIAVTY